MKSVSSLIIVASIVILSGCVAHVSETALIRATPGTTLPDGRTEDETWLVTSLDIQRPDGAALYAAHFTRKEATALVLYFGGNGFVISKHHRILLDVYKKHPVDVLMVDHRGYGGSGGVASLDAMLTDAVAAYDIARNMPNYQGRPIIVHGQSLGSFMAGEVARQRVLDGLVLESSATTAEDWVQGFVDASIFVRKGVVEGDLQGKGNLVVMQSLDEPVLIVVGDSDNTTRSDMSAALYAAASLPNELKELLIVPGAGHNNAILGTAYRDAFGRLLSKATSR